MRTQISTNVSQRTRWQADELTDKLGYSLRDVVTIAIDRLYRAEMPGIASVSDDRNAYHELATQRVDNTPELEPYRQCLIDYDWSEAGHYEWVATAPVKEILGWAQTVK